MPDVLTLRLRRRLAPRALGLVLGAMALNLPHQAWATVTQVNCGGGSMTALGTAIAAARPGDTLAINGTCIQDVTITTRGLTLTFFNSALADSIQGQVEVAGAKDVTVTGLLLGVNTGSFSFASPSDQAVLYVHDGASVVLNGSTISNSQLLGILAAQSAEVSLLDSSVLNNGLAFSSATSASPNGFGIRAVDRSSIFFKTVSTGVFVEFNLGGGVALTNGSTLDAAKAGGSSIDSNGGQQIVLQSNSSVHATNMTIDGFSCSASFCGDAIDAFGGSTVRVDGSPSFAIPPTIQAAATHNAVLVQGGSTLLISGNTVFAPASTTAVIQASDNSVLALAGGNTVCSGACSSSTSGVAVVIDHVSTLIDVAPSQFGYSSAADAIFGTGQAQLQSTVDLGLGLIGGSPSLTWNTPSGGVISVAQNSSFRLDGGVDITGAVTLSQGSNGFFNTGAGSGTNVVSAGVTCPFSFVPGAHVLAGTLSALSPAPPLAASFDTANAAAKQCLPF